ncbi:MAG: SWIM zinc finger domain-containing protein [Prevotella sp.]|jgi:hypothetical protein|nr:SWIM zinc finger domain-containing protein [Prevotella sp.]
MNKFISLEEISPDNWRARYQGNYGVYTIKMTLDGNEATDFSCSCPSSRYPCKHIAMVKKAIAERMAEIRKPVKEKEITVESVLKDVPQKELYDFLVRQARYNPELTNTLLLEFSHKISAGNKSKNGDRNGDENSYSLILRKTLENTYITNTDLYDYGGNVEIDALDQWIDKAQTYAKQGNYREAVLISKACIEEYADWLQKTDSYMTDYINPDYQTTPFEILNTALTNSGVEAGALFDYCQAEMAKPKYSETDMFDEFNDLLMTLSAIINPDGFINLQDNLLSKVPDKSSYEAQKILQRKIDFYTQAGQPEKAWEVMETNLQIESYRKKVVEKKIENQQFTEVKKLIKDFIKGSGNRYPNYWHDFLLTIAQKEKDAPAIREISFEFLKSQFDAKYFRAYKSTFTGDEWQKEVETLIKTYEKSSQQRFSSNIAEVLVAEKAIERLIAYIEKYPSLHVIEQYYSMFSASFPEKTLALFRQEVDIYAKNTGRNSYETILDTLKKMRKIKGGETVVADMVGQYKICYKNRKVMIEILNRL